MSIFIHLHHGHSFVSFIELICPKKKKNLPLFHIKIDEKQKASKYLKIT